MQVSTTFVIQPVMVGGYSQTFLYWQGWSMQNARSNPMSFSVCYGLKWSCNGHSQTLLKLTGLMDAK
jgi:hypothetical protein